MKSFFSKYVPAINQFFTPLSIIVSINFVGTKTFCLIQLLTDAYGLFGENAAKCITISISINDIASKESKSPIIQDIFSALKILFSLHSRTKAVILYFF